jgi:hypothetical protein
LLEKSKYTISSELFWAFLLVFIARNLYSIERNSFVKFNSCK